MRRKLALGLVFIILLAGGSLAWWWAHPPLSPLQWQAWVPAQAQAVAWTQPLGKIRPELKQLITALPGASGVGEALQWTAGVDLLDAEATQEAGFRDDAGIAAFTWQDAFWLVLPVRGQTGAAHALKVLADRGFSSHPTTETSWDIADRNNPQVQAMQAWLIDDVLLVRQGPVQAQALAAWRGATKRAIAPDTLGMIHLEAQIDPALRQALHAGLGPANLLVGGAVDKLQRMDAQLVLNAQGPDLRVSLRSADNALADMQKYHQDFLGSSPALTVGDLLADETVLLLQARINPGLLSMIPQGIRGQWLPASALRVVDPNLGALDANSLVLGAWDGQIALAILGIADSVPLDPRLAVAMPWRSSLRLALILSLRTAAQAQAVVDMAATTLVAQQPQATQLGQWHGFFFTKAATPWGLVASGPRLAFISGEGELADLTRTASGRFPSLGQAKHDPVVAEIIDGKSAWVGVVAQTPRVVRSLRRRGMPDYVVQLVDSIESFALKVDWTASSLELHVHLSPHGTAPREAKR